MNSEKVKELKEFIEGSAKLGCYYKLANCDITMLEVLEYINKLESENKTLLESCKNCHCIKDLEIANGHTKELKDRIAVLEKENKELYKENNGLQIRYRYAVDKMCELSTERYSKVVQFAEICKEKIKKYMGYENPYYETTKKFACDDINISLNAFINLGDEKNEKK